MATVKKGVLTQGTRVWIKHGDVPTLTLMQCITGIELGDDSPNEIQNTCLEETDTTSSVYGLNTPGEGSITINTDPENASHIELLKLADEMADVEVIIGWSDGKVVPTLSADTVTLPEGRTFTTFKALLRASSPTFEPDSLVAHTISMKRQSKAITQYKTA